MDQIIQLLVDFLQGIPFEQRLTAAVGLVFLDTGLGILRAVMQGEFDWDRLPSFLWTNLTQRAAAYALAHSLLLGSQFLPDLVDFGVIVDEAAVFGAWIAVVLVFAKDIVEKARDILRLIYSRF